MKPETFQQLKQFHSEISYLKRKLNRLEAEAADYMAKKLDLPSTESDIMGTLSLLIAQNEERIDRLVEEEKLKELNRKADAKNKTLKRAIDNAEKLGLSFSKRPNVRFGTTEDHSYRIVGMSEPNEEGESYALIWSGGASWSDNGGQHYGESSLDIRSVCFDKKGNLEENRSSRGLYNLIIGGKLTVRRLTEIQDKIRTLIPSFEPAIMPWEYTLIYPKTINE